MPQKEILMQASRNYELWSQKDLNQRILALYDQIEQFTIENLGIAQHNGQLEIQIRTIDQIIQTHSNQFQQTSSISQPQVSVEDYNQLLNNHVQLVSRVSQIEQFLTSKKNSPSFMIKDNNSTLHKVTSIQDLMKPNRTKTLPKGKIQKNMNGCSTARKDQTKKLNKY